MKKLLSIITSVGCGILCATSANGACYQISCGLTNEGVSPTASNCSVTRAICYSNGSYDVGITSCETCKSGYISISRDTYLYCDGSLKVTYNTCVPQCTSSNCKSDTSWYQAINAGYQYRTIRSCTDNITCSSRTEYRCASGYYGTSSNGTTGCNHCPEQKWSDNVSTAATSNAGSTVITDCYLQSGTSGFDSTGDFIYTSNCHYSN